MVKLKVRDTDRIARNESKKPETPLSTEEQKILEELEAIYEERSAHIAGEVS